MAKVLKEEERELLREFKQHPHYKACLRLLSLIRDRRASRMIDYDLEQGSQEVLVGMKRELDGMRNLIIEFDGYLAKLTNKSLDE